MSDLDQFRGRLQAVIAERLGAPGEINNLTRLTGGATRITWSLDAMIADAAQPLICQQALDRHLKPRDPIRGLARVFGDQDAMVMIAAGRQGVPVPRVRLILS